MLLSAKRGKRSVSSLKGASRGMYKSMSKAELRRMAKTRRKKLPKKSDDRTSRSRLDRECYYWCMVAIACLKGSRLTLLVPVKGWSST